MAESVTSIDPAIQEAATDIGQAAPTIIHDVTTKNVGGLASEGESLYSQLSPLVPTIVQEAKAGYKTTEFYILLLWEAASQTGAIHLPGTWGKLVAGLGGITAYILSRGLAKSGTPHEVPSV